MEKIKLRINDKEIPLNAIMKNVLVNINLGLVKVLKGIPENIKIINIKIEMST